MDSGLQDLCQAVSRQGQARTLGNLGNVYNNLSDYHQAIIYYEQALLLFEAIEDRQGQARTLNNLGSVYDNLSDYRQAIIYYEQALPLFEAIEDRQGQARTLGNLGNVYDNLSDYRQAIIYYEQALPLFEAIEDRQGQARTLGNLGSVYNKLSDYHQAIIYHEQALLLFEAIEDRQGQARTLGNLGSVYNKLSDYRQAIIYHEQALLLFEAIEDRQGQAQTLGNLGSVYAKLSDYHQAIIYYEQVLLLFEAIEDRRGQAQTLGNLGNVYNNLSDYRQAIIYHEQALLLFEAIEDRRGQAQTLGNLGSVYAKLSDYRQAIIYYEKALPLYRQIGDREGEGILLSNLGELFVQQEQLELAIIFYKASVNIRESIRENVQELSQDLEKTYLQEIYTDSVAGSYRTLAKLLLEQGRIPEAQQVLDLLQLEDLREFTDTRAVWTSDGIRLSGSEEIVYKAHDSLIALGSKLIECERNNCAELETLLDQQESLLDQYKGEVDRFDEIIRANRRDDRNFQDPNNISVDARKLLEAYAANEQNTLLVYPFVLEDKLWLVWATVGDVVGSIEVPVEQGELATTVQQFGALLKSRSSDLNELQTTSQKLYNWIIQPLADELEKNDIDHLVFVNDRVTRYIPMGALYDGENYLLENYTVSTVLSPTATDMDDRLGPVTDSNVLGLGLTEAVDIDDQTFNPLPAVRDELAGIIKGQDGDGVYPGQTFLNQEFTLDAFKNNLRGNRILHMATHAAFIPGQPKESFIVLGDGERLEIPDIETMTRRLKDLHLVVLSACQTALGETNQEDGTEIAGLSSYFLEANRSGAVVASLWNVNDQSTSVLMQRFYENMAAGETKAEALRNAQLSLLGSDQTADGDERIIGQRQADEAGAAPLSHPYFWAPFIMIGNGL
ncbi:hypothetical protein Lepto7375DRAFT_1610 [Leptolyngbya sp. PCC 7375]|nr:hypothetical protein Lepto7375DRAFT_1610 [Leptolyngbya sp. PCC 7375]